MKVYYAAIAVLVCLISFGAYYFDEGVDFFHLHELSMVEKVKKSDDLLADEGKSRRLDKKDEDAALVKGENTCIVYLTGEVKNTGIYEIKEESRLYELIDMAGGFTEDANTDAVNLARFLFDGEQIHIYAKAELETSIDGSKLSARSGKVSINSADLEDLSSLKGIGESRAQDIIDFRKENGPFKKLEDIMQVKGIKDSLFNKIKDDIIL